MVDIKYLEFTENLELYVSGKITSSQLLKECNNEQKDFLYYILNRLVNYQNGVSLKHYIELPHDTEFNTYFPLGIYTKRVSKVGKIIDGNIAIKPSYLRSCMPYLFSETWVEITGNFSSDVTVIKLTDVDWYKIIGKYPDLYSRMFKLIERGLEIKNDNEMNVFISASELKKCVDADICKYIGNGTTKAIAGDADNHNYLSSEVIDIIKFVPQIEYVLRKKIETLGFDSFSDLLADSKMQ